MNNFVYNNTVKVYFGKDQLGHIGKELSRFGKKVLLTYGGGSIKKSGLYDKVVSEIQKAGLELFEFGGIEPNPRVESVNAAAAICRENNIDVLLAVGGGSTIDATKVIGAATFYQGDAWDLVTRKAKVTDCLPIVTVLTLSATGSEMNSGGVISKLSTNEKYGLSHPTMLPKVSFLDPSNTFSVNAFQTASGAADIMSHVIEQYFNMDEDLKILDYTMEGIMKTVIEFAPIAIAQPENYEARANLMWASSWALNSFVTGGKRQAWSVHPMEHELSAFYDITHGLGLAILTPRWMAYCLDEKTVSRYVRFGVEVFGLDPKQNPMDIARESIRKLSAFFFETLKLSPTLSSINIDETHFKVMAEKACEGKDIKGFKTLNASDIENIFKMCL